MWNEEARISCEFAFKCPKVWDRLAPTNDDRIRHCSACDRDVHLALSEDDFRRSAEEGLCVAVRVISTDQPEQCIVGNAHRRFPSPLRLS
jgi:hypothetical protein